VVTYETVLEVDNSDLLLRPGMTATAEIVTSSVTDTVLVPNAALRFTPEGEQMPGANRPPANGALSAIMPMPRMRMGGGGAGGQQGAMRRVGRAWILEAGKPALVLFKPGVSDGRMTQALPLEAMPNLGRMAAQNPEAEARLHAAMERKLEPGAKVIVDAETPTPKP
jgi:HlyD family secretion protein